MKLGRVVVLLGWVVPGWAQYAGPAILTRGEAPSAMATPAIHFRPFVEISGVYDSGLAGVSLTDQGQLANTSAFGMGVTWGVSGVHSWKHTRLGLDYRGTLNHYFQRTFYDSVDQSMMLGITHQFTRRIMFSLREAAGIFSRDFGLLSLPQTATFDPATAYIPTTDFFDNRTLYLTSQADLTFQKSARLSFDMGGMGAITRRRSKALFGTSAGGAHGDMQYRLSRYTTIGANYAYQHYEFTRVFGGTDAHFLDGAYARQITRLLEFSGYAGVVRVETKFIRVVPIDPAIAALLGLSASSEIAHDIRYAPNLSGRLSRTFQTGVAYFAAGHTVTPGNGLFATTLQTSLMVGYSYTGLRRWSVGGTAGWERGDSVGNVYGVYDSVGGSLTVSRQIIPSLHFIASYSARKYDSPDFSRYNRVIHSARVGLGFSPGDVPLRIW